MDIRRLYDKKSKKFKYYDSKSRKLVKKPSVLKRILSLKIPPAYKKVVISNSNNSKVQAIGEDVKCRKQYIYNPRFVEEKQKEKFSNLVFFGRRIKRIRKDINDNIGRCSRNTRLIRNKNNMISVILYLIDRCNFRVGCEKYKDLYNTYGVTTLNKNHLNINENSVTIQFTGKKGVLNKDNIQNSHVCRILKELYYNSRDEYIFNYIDDRGNKYRINEKHINDWLKKYDKRISVKMFRTWNSNYILLKEILNFELPHDERQAKKNINIAVKKAASQLHHTANVSKKSYMDNEIITLYVENPLKFKKLVESHRKQNGNLPTISRLLNLIIISIKA